MSWIQEELLSKVALRLRDVYIADPHQVNGQTMAMLAKRLLAAEVVVGGPYRDPREKMIVTNKAIAQLFAAFGSPLPNVIRFLEESGELAPQSLSSHKKPSSSPAANEISGAIRTQLTALPSPVKETALTVWESVLRVDKRQEISHISHIFAASLKKGTVQGTDLQTLGEANFAVWMAYTLYDDFIDEEATPDLLPVANMMHRLALQYFEQVAPSPSLVRKTFDDMDIANAWEVAHCRFEVTGESIVINTLPRYGSGMVLARRAKAHVLGPLIITSRQTMTARQRTLIKQGLEHYLIARQLNDDIHDWVEDLSRGHISFVVAFLLRKVNIKPGKYKLAELIKKLRDIFWKSELQAIATLTIEHADQARQLLLESEQCHPETAFFMQILEPIAESARQTIAIHQDQKEFLATYARPMPH